MPLELIAQSPRNIGYAEYSDHDPVADQVLVQTLVSGIKHGTELNTYRGTLPFASELWDPRLRLFRLKPSRKKSSSAGCMSARHRTSTIMSCCGGGSL